MKSFMSLRTSLLAMFLVVLVFNSDIYSATPVDIYQDMESGNDGDLLTPDIMDASSHGTGSWTIDNNMWVSNSMARQLPGPVIAGGVTYNGSGGTRTWKFNDNNANNYVTVSLSGSYSQITVACYYTPGVTIAFGNQFDTIAMSGDLGYSVMQTTNWDGMGPYIRAHSCTEGWVTTFSPAQIKIVSGKTYWVNLQYDGPAGKTYVAVFDPDNSFTQVGDTVVADSVVGSTMKYRIYFGRTDNHGPNPTATTQSYFDHILVDYTNAAFPLIPGGGTSDTTPPSAPGSVSDGTGTDIDSALSTTQLSANWTAATDDESTISRYDYAIGTTPGGTNVLGWTSNGTALAVTKTGLSLTIGTTYCFSVKGVNGQGLAGNATNSNGQVVVSTAVADTTPPSPPAQVRDGTDVDIDSMNPITELSVNWSAAADAESGISRYSYAIGSSPGATDITGWTSTGNGELTSVTQTGLSLVTGTTYYFSIKAENGVGLQSTPVNSDGVCIISGELPPVISNVQATNITGNSVTISWTTDKQATSQVEYGLTAVYGSQTTEDSGLVTAHSVTITGLISGSTYHYRVISKDSNGRMGTSIDFTFATLSTPNGVTDIRAYPNPHDFSNGAMTFVVGPARNVSHSNAGGEVKIYTMNGKLVKTLTGTDKITWNGTNEDGEKVSRGLYIYKIIEYRGDTRIGKIVVIR